MKLRISINFIKEHLVQLKKNLGQRILSIKHILLTVLVAFEQSKLKIIKI